MKIRENMSKIRYIFIKLCIFSAIWTFTNAFDSKTFDDTILFKLNWPGKEGLENLDLSSFETLEVTTKNNEKYQCLLPQNLDSEKGSEEKYEGPTAMELLTPLLNKSPCTYKLETYWSYELCHGKHVRQYHEDRDTKQQKLQEFFLGKFDKVQLPEITEYWTSIPGKNLPVKKIDGMTLPYIQINMSDGTICDLNGKPRLTRVQYVCYAHGKNDIYSIKEASTCEYEAIILTPLLCLHPDFKPHETDEHAINCLPMEGSPKKPKELLTMEAESLKLRHQRQSDMEDGELIYQDDNRKIYAVYTIDKNPDETGEARVRIEIHPVDFLNEVGKEVEEGSDPNKVKVSPTGPPSTTPTQPSTAAESPVKNFLDGKNCLTGGTGWWKYEFCYGQKVTQYHEEKDGSRTVIELGRFNLFKHLEWLEKNPHKRPRNDGNNQRKQLSQFYTDGSFCEKAEKPRQVEVKLKCVEDLTAQSSSVALYLLEPKVCEYLLGVESPALCDLINKADNNGLFTDMFLKTLPDIELEEENDLADDDNEDEENEEQTDNKQKKDEL